VCVEEREKVSGAFGAVVFEEREMVQGMLSAVVLEKYSNL
jgi:hypothetical protein